MTAGESQNIPPVRLKELDRDEWWDVMRRVRPDLSRKDYDAAWDEFQAVKPKRQLQ